MVYNYIDWDNKVLKIGIYSMHYSSVKREFVDYQKKVFEKFNININQIEWPNEGYPGHSNFLNFIARTEDVDYFIFFDIDSIPLRKDFIHKILERIYNKNAILGPEQITSHISEDITKGPFAAPSCFCISKEFYNILGEPSFEATPRGDVAQELTHLCRENGYSVEFIKFKSSKEKLWTLREGEMYGPGTTYEDLVYHNFGSLSGVNSSYFVEKAEEIINFIEIKDFIDKIYYINLDSRTDRNEDTIEELKKWGLYEMSERVSAFKGTDSLTFSYGSDDYRRNNNAITLSHLEAIKKAKELDLDRILILEDDITFLPVNFQDPFYFINNCINEIKKIKDWDVLYLGGTIHQDSIFLERPFLMKVENLLGAHAYIVNKRSYDRILNFYKADGVAIDILLLALENKYSVYPGPAGQRYGSVDNNGKNSSNIDPYNLYVKSYLDKILFKNFLEEDSKQNFKYEEINSLDVSKCVPLIKHQNEKNHFLDRPGVEHYRLLAYFSTKYINSDILDIGSFSGLSALALSYNSKNRVHSFDIVNKLDLVSTPSNVLFYTDNILNPKYESLIKYSKFIFIDITHNGEDEKIITNHIIKLGYKGYILYDDIKLNDEMRNFFNSLEGRKTDISHVGHWSGTGILEIL